MDQKPSVSRMVHYVSYGTPGGEYPSVCRAAVITEVGCWVTVVEQQFPPEADGRRVRELRQWWHEDACKLNVLNPTGEFFNECLHDETTKKPGSWHWPERV